MPTTNKRRRDHLWRQNPRCYWCGIITVRPIGDGPQQPNYATLDHLYHGLHPERFRHDTETVLACYACNQTRGSTENAYYESLWQDVAPKQGMLTLGMILEQKQILGKRNDILVGSDREILSVRSDAERRIEVSTSEQLAGNFWKYYRVLVMYLRYIHGWFVGRVGQGEKISD